MEKIPNHIVEQIIKSNDIVNVISDYVTLDKKGKNYFGLCPFHQEKTPSFSVSPEKQIFHCFSCGEGGNVVQFISKIDNLSFLDALKKLASRVNLNISEYFVDNNNIIETKYYAVNQFVNDYYQFALNNTKEGKEALNYLYNRHMNDEIIKQFQIGLAPDSKNSLYLALKENHFTELSMLELGHVTKVKQQFYDKFKNRIMFPIRDIYGNVVGFSGRTYLETHKKEPKYINTQETRIFTKGNIIYNLYHAKKAIKQKRRVFLFEGFMDVIASVKSNVLESVATMGTALTDSHAQLLKSLTHQVIVCYDGDKAGISATKKAIEILRKHQLNVSVVTLPEGLDPDEYVNQYGDEQFREYLESNQKSYQEYMYELNFKSINFNDISTIDAFKKRIFQLIATATPTERELFLNKLSRDINVSFSTLEFDFRQYTQYIHKKEVPSSHDVVVKEQVLRKIDKNRPSPKKLYETQKILLYFCLYNRKFVNIISRDTRITFKDPQHMRLFMDLYQYYNTYDNFNYENFMQKYVTSDASYLNYFEKIYHDFQNYTGNYDEVYLEQCFAVVINEYIANLVSNLKNQLKTTTTEEEKQKISQKIIENLKVIKVKN